MAIIILEMKDDTFFVKFYKQYITHVESKERSFVVFDIINIVLYPFVVFWNILEHSVNTLDLFCL